MLSIAVLQSSIDIQTPGVTGPQILLALLVLAFVVAILFIAQYRTRFVGLPEEETRHARAIDMQLDAKTPARARFPITTDFIDQKFRIRDLWHSDGDETAGRSPDEPPSVREAIGEIHGILLEQWRGGVDRIPLFAVRLVEEALVLLVLGAIAVVSIERWEHVLGAETPTPDLGSAVTELQTLTIQTAEAGVEALALFPYGQLVWSLAFAYGMLTYQWLYHNWFVLSGILIAGAIAIAYLDQEINATDARLIENRRTVAGSVIAILGGIWLAGVIPTGLGAAAGYHDIGATIGFAAAFLAAVIAFGWSAAWLANEIRRAADWYTDDQPSHSIAAYLLVRRIWGFLAVIAATLIPVYLVVILADGRLFAVIGAFQTASTEIQLLVAIAAVTVLVGVVVATRDAWPDLAAALRSKLGEQSVKHALFGRGAPLGVMVLVYLIAIGFGFPVGVAILTAIIAGGATRGLYLLAAAVKYRSQQRNNDLKRPAFVYIEAYTIEDADGRDHYVARVNGEPLARSHLSPLVDAVIKQASSLRENGDYTAAFARHHADELLNYGIVDEARSRYSMKREITATYDQLLDEYNGRVPPDAADEELADYPADLVEEKKRHLQVKGADGWRMVERGGYLVRA